MVVRENTSFTDDYYDPEKRAIPNSIQVYFRDGSSTRKVTVHYPVGHRRRREEGIGLLRAKFAENVLTRFSGDQAQRLVAEFADPQQLDATPISKFLDGYMLPSPDPNRLLA